MHLLKTLRELNKCRLEPMPLLYRGSALLSELTFFHVNSLGSVLGALCWAANYSLTKIYRY